ncbi:MAG: hypothetical protein R3E86_14535 [Pseudomonadales bacterium]
MSDPHRTDLVAMVERRLRALKARSRPAFWLVLLAVPWLVLEGGLRVIDSAIYPWAYAWTGVPRLTGTWHGSLEGSDAASPVTLELVLRRAMGGGSRNRTTIHGTGVLCMPGGRPVPHDVWGWTEDWRGAQLELRARAIDEPARGYTIAHLSGTRIAESIRVDALLLLRGDPDTGEAEVRGALHPGAGDACAEPMR